MKNINKDAEYKYFSLILFIFQFLGLLIFLEIVELNFFNLEENTKRNIGRREEKESLNFLNFQEQYIEEREDSPEAYQNLEMGNISSGSSFEY